MKRIINSFNKSLFSLVLSLCVLFSLYRSNASIIYHDITPDSLFFLQEVPFQLLTGSHVPIDFNSDSVVDCSFGWSTLTSGFGGDDWAVYMESGDSILTEFKMDLTIPMSNEAFFVAMLDFGDTINGSDDWSSLSPRLADENESHFSNQGFKYIGVKFIISGESHFGWIQVSINTTAIKSVTVTGFAYETTPSMPILAGYIMTGTTILVDTIDLVTLGGDSVISSIGDTIQMIANVLPVNASDTTISWLVNNITGFATINSFGVLTAVGNGTVEVIASANDISGVTGTKIILIDDPTMDIEESKMDELRIYPNPSSDIVIIEFQNIPEKVRLMDSYGHVIFQQAVEGVRLEWSLQGLDQGVYYIETIEKNGRRSCSKVVH